MSCLPGVTPPVQFVPVVKLPLALLFQPVVMAGAREIQPRLRPLHPCHLKWQNVTVAAHKEGATPSDRSRPCYASSFSGLRRVPFKVLDFFLTNDFSRLAVYYDGHDFVVDQAVNLDVDTLF